MCGNGIYTLPNGLNLGLNLNLNIFRILFNNPGGRYQGEMLEGRFHGNGELCYPDGHIIKGLWNQGSLETVERHIFSDGLIYETTNWNYCQSSDRRFQECRINGLPGVLAEDLKLNKKEIQQNNEKLKKNIGARIFKDAN